jgi:uncharacterized metal-binding protein
MTASTNCDCAARDNRIFPCSGAADVGAISDQAARKLTRDGAGKMYCLAGIGGRVGIIMETTGAADRILAIDGCPLSCAKNCLEQAGFTDFAHVQLAELGLEKGQSPVSDENINKVCDAGAKQLAC